MPKSFKLYTFIRDGGDGSASVQYYRSKKGRDKAIKKEERAYGHVMDECAGELEFVITDDGRILDARHDEEFYKEHPDYLSILD